MLGVICEIVIKNTYNWKAPYTKLWYGLNHVAFFFVPNGSKTILPAKQYTNQSATEKIIRLDKQQSQ